MMLLEEVSVTARALAGNWEPEGLVPALPLTNYLRGVSGLQFPLV